MRVLVVEDSRTLADALSEGLRDEQMAVDVAYDGLQAATRLDLNAYDVVVLDRDLPGIHGDTICRMITECENPAMVLMLTASGTPAQRVGGRVEDVSVELWKPPRTKCSGVTTSSHCQFRTSRKSGGQGQVTQLGDLEL